MIRILLATLLAGTLAAPHAEEIALPEIGSSDAGVLSPEQERRIGDAFMREVRRSTRVVDDPEVQQYFKSLGYRLAANSTRPSQPFEFFIVDNGVINAFAGPGGHIGVHSGLFLLTESEAELASVMAHEIAHVSQRHLPRAFDQSRRMSIPTMAAMIGALVLGAVDNQAGMAAITAVGAGAAQMRIDFTRANEQEADRVGMQVLYSSGFDPRAMPRFFERMQAASRYSAGNKIPEFLLTHPLTPNRVADTRNRAVAYPAVATGDESRYRHIKARILASTARSIEEAIRFFEQRVKDPAATTKAADKYGLAYAYLNSGRAAQARELVKELLATDPENLSYLIAAARIEATDGRQTEVTRYLNTAARLYPGDSLVTYVEGELLLRRGDAAGARATLNAYLVKDRQNPLTFELLAQAAAQLDRRIEAHQMQAEYYFLTGDLQAAVEQLRIASKLKPISFVELSQIESRLRLFDQEIELERELF